MDKEVDEEDEDEDADRLLLLLRSRPVDGTKDPRGRLLMAAHDGDDDDREEYWDSCFAGEKASETC
jgi:hypothetical protein